ncbi:MAG: hypothetical protein GY758_23015 [Fuerstiella sp.]|nr:hypothetical protein [Fuerstiella sp.]MCP4513570.1 hypothetical protein [Fuerstiella sp.]
MIIRMISMGDDVCGSSMHHVVMIITGHVTVRISDYVVVINVVPWAAVVAV